MVELYLNFRIRLYGAVLNSLSTGITCYLTTLSASRLCSVEDRFRNEYGVGKMKIGRGNRSTWRKSGDFLRSLSKNE
jgi:hypothetical protein